MCNVYKSITYIIYIYIYNLFLDNIANKQTFEDSA